MEAHGNYFIITALGEDRPMPILRTSLEAARHAFIEAYEAWVSSPGPFEAKEELWDTYCDARNLYTKIRG